MKAIILAAGQGTRLKKYTENLPKGMLCFDKKTIIERQIDAYRKCGIEEIAIVRGFAAEKIQYDNVSYYENEDFENTNMVVSLMCASEFMDDDVIVSYSDILFSDDMLKRMIGTSSEFACAVDVKWKDYWYMRYGKTDFDTESLSLSKDGRIESLGRENPRLDEIDARYVGLLKFSKEGVGIIKRVWKKAYAENFDQPWQQSGKIVQKAYMTDLLNELIEEGYNIMSEQFNNGWIEFDTNEDYEKACEWQRTGKLSKIIELE